MMGVNRMLDSDPELLVKGLFSVMMAIEALAQYLEDEQYWHEVLHGVPGDSEMNRGLMGISPLRGDNVSRETNGGE